LIPTRRVGRSLFDMTNKYYSIKEDDLSDIPLVKEDEQPQKLVFYHGVNKKRVLKERKKKKLNKRR